MVAKDMKTNRTPKKRKYGKQSMQGSVKQTTLDQHHPWKPRDGVKRLFQRSEEKQAQEKEGLTYAAGAF